MSVKLFSKLKDYNERLEDILDKKVFSSNVKNLLLSMVYKIEVSYNDYRQVKRVGRELESFLEEILETIKKYCDNIKTVEPDSEEAKVLVKNKVKALTNEKERSILAYPTEVALLYAISDIKPKFFYVKNSFLFKKKLQEVLVDGYNLSNLEILNNFNGWSWDDNQKENMNFINNLIYQNLLLLMGENFLSDWRNYSSTRRNFLNDIKSYIFSITKNNNYFISLCKIMYLTMSSLEKESVEVKLRNSSIEYRRMLNKPKYIEQINIKKDKLTKLVEKTNIILGDEKLLIKEFNKRNEKLETNKRISNIKILVNMLEREKQAYLEEIKDLLSLMKPENFIKRKQELEGLNQILKNENTIQEELIILEKEFLKIIEKKLNKLNTTEEIIDIIYELRYYKNIKITKNKNIKAIKEIEELTDKILKIAITKACKLGIIKILSMDIALNYEIIKYAIDTRIIKLEEIRICLEPEGNSLTIKVYDKEIVEKHGKKTLENAKEQIEIKQKRIVNLFN